MRSKNRPRFFRPLVVLFSVAMATTTLPSRLAAQIAISQIYGGGGNSGATLKNDFVELLNRGTTAVTVTGWSVQYASASDTNGGFGSGNPAENVPVVLSGSIQPGHYYLIKAAAGAGGTVDLPAPDATATFNMGATSGRVVLVRNSTALLTNCTSADIVDLVGYGSSALCSEGSSPAPAPSNTNAILRKNGGCQDTNVNASDFLAGTSSPRNSASPPASCAGTPPTGSGRANPNPACNSATTLLTVTVTPGTNPASTGITVSGNLSSIGGSATQPFYDDATHGDVSAGDRTYSFLATVATTTSAGNKTIPVSIMDAQGRSSNIDIMLSVDRCTPTTTGLVEPIALCTSGGSARVIVDIDPATAPPSTGITVTANLTSIGGTASQQLYDDATHGDRTAADDVFTFLATVPSGMASGAKSISYSGHDAQNRNFNGIITLNLVTCSNAASTVVISQVYGGGGNSGAPFTNDYIELFNRSTAPVSIAGWSVQYASDAGGFINKTDLTGTIPAGGYYLIQEAAGATPSGSLPTPDATGSISLSTSNAKIALVDSTTLIGTNCMHASVRDLVGYGQTSSCFEGFGNAPSPSNTLAVFRLNGGCQDFNQNAPDFVADPPAPRNSGTAAHSCTSSGCACPGNLGNPDNVVNGSDIGPFIRCVLGSTLGDPPDPGCACADLSGDSAVDTRDVGPFISRLLRAASCP